MAPSALTLLACASSPNLLPAPPIARSACYVVLRAGSPVGRECLELEAHGPLVTIRGRLELPGGPAAPRTERYVATLDAATGALVELAIESQLADETARLGGRVEAGDLALRGESLLGVVDRRMAWGRATYADGPSPLLLAVSQRERLVAEPGAAHLLRTIHFPSAFEPPRVRVLSAVRHPDDGALARVGIESTDAPVAALWLDEGWAPPRARAWAGTGRLDFVREDVSP